MEKGETSRQMGDEWDGDGGTPAATPGGGGHVGVLLCELTAIHRAARWFRDALVVGAVVRAYLRLRAPLQTLPFLPICALSCFVGVDSVANAAGLSPAHRLHAHARAHDAAAWRLEVLDQQQAGQAAGAAFDGMMGGWRVETARTDSEEEDRRARQVQVRLLVRRRSPPWSVVCRFSTR
jgi:hypothetical protein